MASLSARDRAQLPDKAFAYIASDGRRRLPIHDAAHVRNALARFSQVAFEDDEARDAARTRLLRAAKKHGIMPLGFINAELRPQRRLPKGEVTFLLVDIERSTELLTKLGAEYSQLLSSIRRLLRASIRKSSGREVDARGDELFAVFEAAPRAVEAAVTIQQEMNDWVVPEAGAVRVRVGLHRGRPALTETGYVGLAVHTVARIGGAAHGGQILLSSAVRAAVDSATFHGLSFRCLGDWRFQGLPAPLTIHQVEIDGLERSFPTLRSAVPVAD